MVKDEKMFLFDLLVVGYVGVLFYDLICLEEMKYKHAC